MKKIIINLIVIIGFTTKLLSQDYIVVFTNPSISSGNPSYFSFDLVLKATPNVVSFPLSGSNVRFNFNNNGLSTLATDWTFTLLAGGLSNPLISRLGSGTSSSPYYVNIGWGMSTPPIVNTSGLLIGRISMKITNINELAGIKCRLYNAIPSYSNSNPTATITNCCRIYHGQNFNELIPSGNPENLLESVLPINMLNFNVRNYIANSTLLTWSTSTEINSDFFKVERSLDGSKWETIGKVDAAGNSNRQNDYKFIDENLKLNRDENIFYYRLKMVDLDGTYKYSEVRNILFANDKNIVQVFPNPTKDVLNIDLSGLDINKGEITIIIIDQSGKNVMVKKYADNALLTIGLKELPAGNYNVIVKQNEDVYFNKIVKIK